MTRITEQPSAHRHLEKKSIEEITAAINNEDKIVASAIEKALPQLNQLIAAVVNKLKHGGRLFYLGAGPVVAVLLGMALAPWRDMTPASNFTFVFLALTILVAGFGGRWAAGATALVSALSLDFFLTEPYRRLAIAHKHDLIAFVGLAVCGLIAAAFGAQRSERTGIQKLFA